MSIHFNLQDSSILWWDFFFHTSLDLRVKLFGEFVLSSSSTPFNLPQLVWFRSGDFHWHHGCRSQHLVETFQPFISAGAHGVDLLFRSWWMTGQLEIETTSFWGGSLTPPKVERMEPANDGFKKEAPFPGPDFQVNHLKLQGCIRFFGESPLKGQTWNGTPLNKMNKYIIVFLSSVDLFERVSFFWRLHI